MESENDDDKEDDGDDDGPETEEESEDEPGADSDQDKSPDKKSQSDQDDQPNKQTNKPPPPAVKPKPKPKLASSSQPVFLSPLENHNAEEGSLVRMDVKIKSDSIFDVEWFYGEELITSENYPHITLLSDDDVFSMLFTQAKIEHSGLYTCSVKSDGGQVKCSAELRIAGL